MSKLLLLSLALAGCAQDAVSATPTHPAPRPNMGRSAGPVEVWQRPPPRPYVSISELMVPYSGDYDAESKELVGRAGALGCDGIILGPTRETAEGRRVLASCIVYKDAPPSQQEAIGRNLPSGRR